MTSTGLHDVGEEWAWKTDFRQDLINSREGSIEVLLYLDNSDIDGDGTNEGDALTDASDIGDITTEPSDGNYTRQSLSLDTTDLDLTVSGGDILLTGLVTFDVTNTTGSVDAWGAKVDFQSDIVNAEGAKNPHLLSTAAFNDGARDLSNYDSLDVQINISLT